MAADLDVVETISVYKLAKNSYFLKKNCLCTSRYIATFLFGWQMK